MELCSLNIHPNKLPLKKIKGDYIFSFLDNIFENIDINPYYLLILSLDNFCIKNIYNFLFLRSLKINHRFSTRKMNLNKYINTYEELNNELETFIKKEKMYAIIIMNGIQHYFIPYLS